MPACTVPCLIRCSSPLKSWVRTPRTCPPASALSSRTCWCAVCWLHACCSGSFADLFFLRTSCKPHLYCAAWRLACCLFTQTVLATDLLTQTALHRFYMVACEAVLLANVFTKTALPASCYLQNVVEATLHGLLPALHFGCRTSKRATGCPAGRCLQPGSLMRCVCSLQCRPLSLGFICLSQANTCMPFPTASLWPVLLHVTMQLQAWVCCTMHHHHPHIVHALPGSHIAPAFSPHTLSILNA